MASYRWRVSGRVQGVGFRNYVRKHAKRLGVVGYARNHSDGSVEVHGVGEDKALESLAGYIRRGPMLAEVEHFEGEKLGQEAEAASYDGFDIR